MITLTDDELLSFFISKVECNITQMKERGLRVGTSTTHISSSYDDNDCDVWIIEEGTRTTHPLALSIENQKMMLDKTVRDAMARRMGCKVEHIAAFNSGLRGLLISLAQKTCDTKTKFHSYGQKIRTKYILKRAKGE